MNYWDQQPFMEAFYRCELGEYTLLELKRRTAKAELPEVYTVDMREELQKGNRSILSDRLHELMEDRLKKKEQIILFLNRRGYAGFLSCRSCGYVVKCPHCDVSLAAHNNGKMVCHYCGYEEKKKRLQKNARPAAPLISEVSAQEHSRLKNW